MIAAAFVLVGRPVRAHAQPPTPEPERIDDPPRLLLLSDTSELAFPIERAIRTELNDVEVALEVLALVRAYDLRDRIGVAEQEVASRGALGAVWVEEVDGGLVVYLVVAQAGMVRRTIAGESQDAAVEAAAVVILHFTTELLEGRSIGLTPVDVDDPLKPEPEPEIEAPPDPIAVEILDPPARIEAPEPWRLGARARLRIQVGYLGQAWAPQQRWASGGELSVAGRTRIGVHVGVGYTLLPAYSNPISHTTGLGVAEVVVRRFPPTLIVGYQHVWERARVALDTQLRGIVEVVERSAIDLIAERAVAIVPRLVAVPALEPRVQIDWLFRPPLSLNLALGLRVNMVDYTYGLDLKDTIDGTSERREYLTPYLVAPTVQIGLGVFL